MNRIVSVVMMTGFLAACGTYGPPGATAEYNGGYTNGCQNGYEDGGRANHWASARDQKLYETDTDYQEGWDAGYAACFDRAISTPYGEGGARP